MKKLTFIIILSIFCSAVYSTEKIIGYNGSSGRWIKIARIQNRNPIDGGESSQFSGTLNMQTYFGNTGSQQYYATFSFGSRGGIKPLLFEIGDAAQNSARVEWRIYLGTDGYHYLWFWQGSYSKYANFDYQINAGVEYWTYEDPPASFDLVWSSVNGDRQSINKATFNELNINGNVGIGTNSPSENLEIYNSNTTPGVISLKSARNDAGNVDVGRISAKQNTIEVVRIGMPRANQTNSGYLTFWTKSDNSANLTEKVRISPSGQVGIGTTTIPSGYKLAVAGKIIAKEVKVTLDGWPDFVFANNYQLKTLTEVENYINQNKHLPDVPSAAEVKENGVSLGEMDAVLLQKIEELTLYMIEMKRENEEIIKENKNLKQRVETLENK